MKNLLDKVPALLPLLGWCAGILLWWYDIGPAIAITTAAIGVGTLFFKQIRIGVALLAVGAAWAVAWLGQPGVVAPALTDGSTHLYSGAVVEASGTPVGKKLLMEVDSVDGQQVEMFRVEIGASAGGTFPSPGERVQGELTLREATVHGDLGVEAYMESYYRRKGIAATAYVSENELHTTGIDSPLRHRLNAYREWLIGRLAHSGVDDRTFALLAAIITGYDDELPTDLLDSFRTIGIAHILALSGFHVGFVILLVELLLYPMRAVYRLRRLRLLLSIALIWLYAGIVGMPLSVVRAVIMASVYTLGLAFGRNSNSFNSLCVALIIILAIWPASLFAAGLQLSAAAVLGILAFANALNPVSQRNRIGYNLMSAVTVSIAAFTCTIPLTVLYFHKFPVIFLAANLLATAVMPLWMGGGLLLIVTSACGRSHTWVADATDFVTDFVSKVVNWMADIPWGEITDVYVEPWYVGAAFATIGVIAAAIHYRKLKGWIAACVAIAALIAMYPTARPAKADTDIMLVRAAGTTALVCTDGRQCVVVHSAAERDHSRLAQRLSDGLQDFAAINSIDTILFPTDDFSFGRLSRKGEIVSAGKVTIAIPSRTASCDTCEVDYMLLGTGFRGKLEKLLTHCHPDTIVLGAELTRLRARQYADTAAVRGIPVINLH